MPSVPTLVQYMANAPPPKIISVKMPGLTTFMMRSLIFGLVTLSAIEKIKESTMFPMKRKLTNPTPTIIKMLNTGFYLFESTGLTIN